MLDVADLVIDLADYSNLDTARATRGDLNGLWLFRYSYSPPAVTPACKGEHTIRLHHTGKLGSTGQRSRRSGVTHAS